MTEHRILVAGATGQVGSQSVRLLLDKGHFVRALVRKTGQTVAGLEGAGGTLEYAVGCLEDRGSLDRALAGFDTVVSSANGIIPSGKAMLVASMAAGEYEEFIAAAGNAGVRHWVQSSVPTWEREHQVSEVTGKRLIEAQLDRSAIATTIIRNPAIMHVWLVKAGAQHAAANHPHTTTKRPYGFMKMWQALTGNLVAKLGVFLSPGGRAQWAPFIATIDVAQLMSAVVGQQASYNRTLEAAGPEWLSWSEVADLLSDKSGRNMRVVKLPGWFARTGQILVSPFSSTAANVLGLLNPVASHQPRWEAPQTTPEFNMPPQTTVAEHLDQNWPRAG